jgi:hypothetical protein
VPARLGRRGHFVSPVSSPLSTAVNTLNILQNLEDLHFLRRLSRPRSTFVSSWERRAPLQYSWIRSRRQQERQSSWLSETPTSGQTLISVNQRMNLTVLRTEVIQYPIDENGQVQQGLEETDAVAKVHGMVDHTPLGHKRHPR